MPEIKPLKIKNRFIGPGFPPFIIAEACINHNGNIEIAKEMVYLAHSLGAHCIKFQIHVLENEMLKQAPTSSNFQEPLWDTLEKTNLSLVQLVQLKKLCENLGIIFLCTPFSRQGVDLLEEINVDFYKVGSGEMTNLPLIEHIAKKGKPMIISTGMSQLEEIRETVSFLKSLGVEFALTHCVSAYPAPYKIINLKIIERYFNEFQVPVGLSDHSKGIYTSLGAVALGANIIEKHFTLDKTQQGPDHASSIEPFELAELVKGAKAVFEAMGSERKIFPQEKEIVEWAREAVVSEKDIPAGSVITSDMVWVKRPSPSPGAVPAKDLKKVIGKIAKVDILRDNQVRWEQIM